MVTKISTITATYTRHLENIVIEFKNVNVLKPCTFEAGYMYVVLGTEKKLISNMFPYVRGNKVYNSSREKIAVLWIPPPVNKCSN